MRATLPKHRSYQRWTKVVLGFAAVLAAGVQFSAAEFRSADASSAESLFNGRDLTGWVGEPGFWRVENGALVGERKEEGSPSTYIYYDGPGASMKDFTITLEMRMNASNSGVQYRSRLVDNYALAGYQFDFDFANQHTGGLYEQNGRGITARRGQRVVLEQDSARNPVINQGLPLGDHAAMAAHIKTGDWNMIEITAQGNRIIQKLNGVTTVEVTDNDTRRRANSGILGFQLHSGPPMKVEFRNIMFTPLTSSAR